MAYAKQAVPHYNGCSNAAGGECGMLHSHNDKIEFKWFSCCGQVHIDCFHSKILQFHMIVLSNLTVVMKSKLKLL